jgi:hypothetical protein
MNQQGTYHIQRYFVVIVLVILHSLAPVASSISFTILDSTNVTHQTKKTRFYFLELDFITEFLLARQSQPYKKETRF